MTSSSSRALSGRQISRLERFGKSRVPACGAVVVSVQAFRITANCELPALHAAGCELSYPAARQARLWIRCVKPYRKDR